jgi:hypothetical protein
MKHTHLTDEQLIAMCVTGSAATLEPYDIEGVPCSLCERRRAALSGLLDDVSDSATIAAETAFPPERLARQHARILQRVDQQRLDSRLLDPQARAGRVITFPQPRAQRTSQLRAQPVRRWIAGAAAAGLLIGAVAGRLAYEFPVGVLGQTSAGQQAIGHQASSVPLRAVSGTMSDDEFLREIEAAVGSSGPAALRRLDAVTPVAWEVR